MCVCDIILIVIAIYLFYVFFIDKSGFATPMIADAVDWGKNINKKRPGSSGF